MTINSITRKLEKDDFIIKIVKTKGSLLFPFFSVTTSFELADRIKEGTHLENFGLYIILLNDRYVSVQNI